MFHMPLFISVSGYLFYPSITKEAGAVLNKTYTEEWKLYGGVPAKPIKDISKDAKYFNRKIGFVY